LSDEPSKPKKRRDIVADFRQAHVEELEKTLKVLVSIRDDTDAGDKERTEAGKSILRLLGAMSPESTKAGDKPMESGGIVQPHHKPEVEAELQDLLANLK
jgi:hypothetical protein